MWLEVTARLSGAGVPDPHAVLAGGDENRFIGGKAGSVGGAVVPAERPGQVVELVREQMPFETADIGLTGGGAALVEQFAGAGEIAEFPGLGCEVDLGDVLVQLHDVLALVGTLLFQLSPLGLFESQQTLFVQSLTTVADLLAFVQDERGGDRRTDDAEHENAAGGGDHAPVPAGPFAQLLRDRGRSGVDGAVVEKPLQVVGRTRRRAGSDCRGIGRSPCRRSFRVRGGCRGRGDAAWGDPRGGHV